MTDRQEDRVEALFQDAQALYQEALREMSEGKLRNAAEKAWGATMRATMALVVARTGVEPGRSDQTSRALRELSLADPSVSRRLSGAYYIRLNVLHGDCFYMGILDPTEYIERLIRETHRYIRTARTLTRDGR